jgi:peptide/nickel transport system substrate-binding protein
VEEKKKKMKVKERGRTKDRSISRKKKNTEKVSMKEALSDIQEGYGPKIKKAREKVDIRDYWWNYPKFLWKVFKNSVPFSYTLLFLVVGFLLATFLQSDAVARIIDDSELDDTFVEGSVGAISTFNPLFMSVNYVDKAVQELVFDKLVYIDDEGKPLPGVASEWKFVEEDMAYEFTIKDNLYWQDGERVTVDDIVFTFLTAKTLAEDYGFDSVGISLVGVDVEKVNEEVVRFTLPEPNPTFFEAVSQFIVPKHRLEEERLEELPFNMFARYPIGSGRYKVTRTEQNAVYLQDNEYDTIDPAINNVVLKVFPDQETLEMSFRIGALDAIGAWDRDLLSFTAEYSNLQEFKQVEGYRTKLIFFNTRKETLEGKDIRIGLSYIIDKERLIEDSNIGGVVRKGPFAESSWAFNGDVEYYNYNPEQAAEYFKNLGYVKSEEGVFFEAEDGQILSVTLSYFDSVTNERLVSILKDLLKEEGIVLKSEKLTYNQITQEIIATRDFDLLLYEVETTIDPDQYNLWHSLKSSYPDLNISGYAYERVDILLEDARKILERKERKEKYDLFQKYLIADAPVVFLYNPEFSYYVKEKVKGVDFSNVNYSYQRFNNIQEWVLE